MTTSQTSSPLPQDQLVGRAFKIRVGVVLPKDGKLLMLRQNNRPFWVLPGGTLEFGESLEACAIRELKEETNIDIRVCRLLAVSDFITDNRHVVDFFFLGEYLGGEPPKHPPYPENIDDIGFFTLDELDKIEIQPQNVVSRLLKAWPQGFPLEPQVYLGISNIS